MTIEKLTDADRTWLQAEWCNSQHNEGRRTVALIDAQAAVIERVRAWAETSYTTVPRALAAALAAAPEHTGQLPRLSNGHAQWCASQTMVGRSCDCIAAANARVAELERQNSQLIAQLHGAGARVDAANDRADAAERGWAAAKRETAQWRAACERAESEASALRARVAELEAAAERRKEYTAARVKDAATLRAAVRSAADRLERAEQRETVLDIAAELRKL